MHDNSIRDIFPRDDDMSQFYQDIGSADLIGLGRLINIHYNHMLSRFYSPGDDRSDKTQHMEEKIEKVIDQTVAKLEDIRENQNVSDCGLQLALDLRMSGSYSVSRRYVYLVSYLSFMTIVENRLEHSVSDLAIVLAGGIHDDNVAQFLDARRFVSIVLQEGNVVRTIFEKRRENDLTQRHVNLRCRLTDSTLTAILGGRRCQCSVTNGFPKLMNYK